MGEELLTVDEMCQVLKISRSTLDRWRKQGLPFFKYGNSIRFDKEKVLKWLKQNNKK